jgi:chorismate-pyruvate lyase
MSPTRGPAARPPVAVYLEPLLSRHLEDIGQPDADVAESTPDSAPRALASLPEIDPLDRMLLTADGTVTTLLEACTGEPIVTRTTRQTGPGTHDRLREAPGCWWHPNARRLQLAPTERLIARRVTLRGARSGTAYVLAESLVAPDRLPDRVADRLQRAGASLGRLLIAGLLDTRRDVQHITTVRAGAAGEHLDVAPTATLARRTYNIVGGQRTIAAVTEWLVPGRLTVTALASNNDWPARQPFRHSSHRRHRSRADAEFVADL